MYEEWQHIYKQLDRRNRIIVETHMRIRAYRSLLRLGSAYALIYIAYSEILGLAAEHSSLQLFAVAGAGLSTIVIVWSVYRYIKIKLFARKQPYTDLQKV